MQKMTNEVIETLENHEGFRELDGSLKQLIFDQISRMSETDLLTGTVNRQKMLSIIDTEWARSVRYHSPVSIIMLDVDGFKSINDTHGQDVGDEVLQTVSGIIEKHIRQTDTLSRWGDDEFVITVPTTNNEQATWLAQKLDSLIRETTFMSVGKITCSFGVADRDDSMDLEDWLRIVEVALNEAKALDNESVVDYESISYKDI